MSFFLRNAWSVSFLRLSDHGVLMLACMHQTAYVYAKLEAGVPSPLAHNDASWLFTAEAAMEEFLAASKRKRRRSCRANRRNKLQRLNEFGL